MIFNEIKQRLTYLIELCGLQEDCNVCSKETSKLIMCNSSVPNLLYLPK